MVGEQLCRLQASMWVLGGIKNSKINVCARWNLEKNGESFHICLGTKWHWGLEERGAQGQLLADLLRNRIFTSVSKTS